MILGQGFPPPDNQGTPGPQAGQDPRQGPKLQRFIEVCEHQVSAQDQRKGFIRKRVTDVLASEIDTLTVFGQQAEFLSLSPECPVAPGRRQLFQATRRIAGGPGAVQYRLMTIRGDDRKPGASP